MYETPDKTDFGTICFASFRLTFRFLIVMRLWLQAEFIVIGSICAMLCAQIAYYTDPSFDLINLKMTGPVKVKRPIVVKKLKMS